MPMGHIPLASQVNARQQASWARLSGHGNAVASVAKTKRQ